jgi:transposase
VVVADARKLPTISGSPTKTDRNDARHLARLGLADELVGGVGPATGRLLSDTYVRSEENQRLYTELALRDLVVRRRGDDIRFVRSTVKGAGAVLKGSSPTFHQLRDEVPDNLRTVLDPLFDVIEASTGAITRMDALLEMKAKENPMAARLREIPGVGPITSLAFVAVVGDPKRFSNVRDVGAYVGLVVKRNQSGQMDPSLGISKCGNGFMRRLLVQCATHILGPHGQDCALRRWGLKFIAEKGDRAKKKARVAIARKLAVQMLSIWKRESLWVPFPTASPSPVDVPSATDGGADCAFPLDASELAPREIAAAPTAPIQPCAHSLGVRTDESAESRRNVDPSGSRARASKTPARTQTPASAEGERGCPQPGARVAPAPGPATPARPQAHMDAPRTKTRADSSLNGVGPQPPPAQVSAAAKNDRRRPDHTSADSKKVHRRRIDGGAAS